MEGDIEDNRMFSSRAPLLALHKKNDVVQGCVDYKNDPVHRSSTGRWRSTAFIIGVEVAERCAFYGIMSNLISYLMGPLGMSTSVAAENVNLWAGTSLLLPLLGAFVADSFLGRYRTILLATFLYIIGLGTLTLLAALQNKRTSDCQTDGLSSCLPSPNQETLFFIAQYLVALGQGCHKPCVQAFGADQFDATDSKECRAKNSFFNWWYFSMCGSTMVTIIILNYVQDNFNWALGFGIPCLAMVAALFVFLLGTRTYRYSVRSEVQNVFLRIGRVYIAAIQNWFLSKALLTPNCTNDTTMVCSLGDIEDAESVLRLLPIWSLCLVFATVLAQSSTFFTKQGFTMDRSISPRFDMPAASLQSFIGLASVITIPIYDRVFVPLARLLTRNPSGITMLQRIGTGMFLSMVSMAIAAVVETKRLKIAEEYGLVDQPNATVPMSVWWLIPQYMLFGVADVFTMVGLQEFFYDQVPSELRSVGVSLYLSIFGVGNFLSSFLVSVIEKTTGGNGSESWFANNLNRAHLDYFYWLLAGLGSAQLVLYMFVSKSYVQRRGDA